MQQRALSTHTHTHRPAQPDAVSPLPNVAARRAPLHTPAPPTCDAQPVCVHEVIVVGKTLLRDPAGGGQQGAGQTGRGAGRRGAGNSDEQCAAQRIAAAGDQSAAGRADHQLGQKVRPAAHCIRTPRSLVRQVQAQHLSRLVAPAARHVAHRVAAAPQQQHGHVELCKELNGSRVALQQKQSGGVLNR